MSTSANLTTGFIDLATFDELEKYMYGGADATAYFVRETRKSTWFTQVPTTLMSSGESASFGATSYTVNVSRAGDYLLYAWLRTNIPSVELAAGNQAGANGALRWTRNLMHNLVSQCTISFNDLVAARLDSYVLDMWAAFTTPAGKLNGYRNMIGDIPDLTDPHPQTGNVGSVIPAFTLNLPLPFWFSRDSGVSLATAALPYNDIRINFQLRNWNQLLVLDNVAAVGTANQALVPVAADLVNGAPVLGNTQVWANYAIVSNEERKRMACAPRSILIEQAQTIPTPNFNPGTGGNATPSFDIRFSHAIKVLFFAVKNITYGNQHSNYTAASPVPGGLAPNQTINFSPAGAVDPIITTSLTYENAARLSNMGSDYFSLVQPWYHAPSIPLETGLHVYSYSLDFICLDPKGSTNYGKLTNVSIAPAASAGAIAGANGTGSSGADFAQNYEFVVVGINNNIIRQSGGALGFPVL